MARPCRKNQVVLIQPPFFRLLGFAGRCLGVGISHDAALLKSADFDVGILNLDANPGGRRQRWEDLIEASVGLERMTETDAFSLAVGEAAAAVREVAASAAVLYVGDWAVPAKDMSDAGVALALGRHLGTIGIHTVAVGLACSLHPEVFLRAFDTVIKGAPGETVIEASRGRRGLLSGGGVAPYLGLIPDLQHFSPESDTSRVLASFGCEYGQCTFCSSGVFWRGMCSDKELRAVAADVAQRAEEHISFVDNYFCHDMGRLQDLELLLSPLGKRFTIDVRAEAAEQPGFLRLLRAMNVRTVKVGVESLSDDVLKKMRKGQTVAQVVARLTKFRDAGFDVFAYLLLGSCGEPAETMWETIERAEKLPWARFLPNVFCAVQAPPTDSLQHHFSLPLAGRLGIPAELLRRAARLRERQSLPSAA